MNRCWDVIVVGGGPGGAAAARLLAQAGHGVLLLDRARFPRAKPCGDCLSAGATPLLERLGVLDEVLARSPAQLEGWRFSCPDDAAFDGRFGPGTAPTGALALPRSELDDALVRAAVAAGAHLIEDAHVLDLCRKGGRPGGAVTGVRYRREGRIREAAARLVIGADGLRSVVARRLGATKPLRPPRRVSLTAHVPASLIGLAATADGEAFPRRAASVHGGRPGEQGPTGLMHVDDELCVGLAPLEGGEDPLMNLTVVAAADRYGRVLAMDRHGFVARAASRLPEVVLSPSEFAERLEGRPLLASGPFHRPTRFQVHDGAALVGDAAGYYDPFTGQGIYQALADGVLLAAHAHAALEGGRRAVLARELSGYVRERRRRLRPVRRLQRVIDVFVSRRALFAVAARTLAAAPDFADALVSATGDLRGAGSLVRPGLLGTLVLPTQPRRTPC